MRSEVLRSFILLLLPFVATADIVHVYELISLDGSVTTNSDVTLTTGRSYKTSSAQTKSGWRFTHWTTTAKQDFSSRDDWGRAYDAAPYTLYEKTEFTAHYVPSSRDEDADGLPDGWEIYWYGDIATYGAGDDPDNDDVKNAAEYAAGTNPIFPENHELGPVLYADGDLWLYNPSNYSPYTIKCDPEGAIFETTTAYVKPGTKITTGTYGTSTAKFAYWTVNGVQQRDEWGRAVDAITLFMPTNAVEIVAVTTSGDSDGDGIEDRLELYWYGDLDEGADSDTDGDGKTFAAEIAAGTNPLMAENHAEGPIAYVDDALWQYNPYGLQPYTLKCDPEGAFFATTNLYVRKGKQVTTSTYSLANGFSCWKFNGVEQRDEWGRSDDNVSFFMPTSAVELIAVQTTGDSDGDGINDNLEYYWYGDLDENADSDSDGDGKTFAAEIAAGTNPLMAENHDEGPIAYVDTTDHELNLQVYEQVLGTLIENEYVQLFTSPIVSNNATSVTFDDTGSWSKGGENGSQIWPVVADVDGDGLWDLIVLSETSTNVFLNTGTKGNPQFADCGPDGAAGVRALPAGVLEMNSTDKFAEMSLDVDPVNALSATTNCATMLVSDTEGRIWLYVDANVSFASNEDESSADAFETNASTWVLQHKVWGGSYAGFAEGLMLAAVDWEDDGDLDCICGTADGKLMLLRDPKVGRPTGLEAEAGVDSVVLNWDPNPQSRVRGYKVYRAVDDSADYGVRGAPALPTYRDTDVDPASYSYKVTAMSRFYTAGNSTPTETESIASDPVMATVGTVKFAWNDEKTFTKTNVEVRLSIENAMHLSGEGGTLVVNYDPAKLTPVKVQKSGLTDDVTVEYSLVDGVWNVTLKGGDVSAGSGTFLTFVFAVGDVEAGTTTVSLASAVLSSIGGTSVPVSLPDADAKIELVVYNPPEPAHAVVTVTDSVSVTSGVSFVVAVAASGDDINADSLQYTFDYDTSLLTYANGEFTAGEVTQVVTTVISLKDVSVDDNDGAAAIVDSCGSVSVAILPKADESDPGDGDEIGDNDDGDDDTFPDWNEQEKGITKFGLAAFDIGSAAGKTLDEVSVPIMLRSDLVFRDLSVNYATFRFRLAYDATLIEPIAVNSSVGKFELSVSDGILIVVGKSGSEKIGRFPATRTPVTITFRILEQYAKNVAAITPIAVQVRTTDGAKIYTPIRYSGAVAITFERPQDDASVVAPYGRGDLNGDGRLTKEDRQLLAELMNGKHKKITPQQLAAGDYNGNQRLDNGDYQLLTQDFRERGIINGNGGNR